MGSLLTICLCHLGRDGLASWQRTQWLKLTTSIFTSGSSACAWRGPWHASQESALCCNLANFGQFVRMALLAGLLARKDHGRARNSASAAPRYQPYSPKDGGVKK